MTQAKYKAEIHFGVGGSYAYDDDCETAIRRVIEIAHNDWSGFYDLCGQGVTIRVKDRSNETSWTEQRVFPSIHFATNQELAIELAEVINIEYRAKSMTEDELHTASNHLQKLVKRAERTEARSGDLEWYTDGHDEVIRKMLNLIEQAQDTIDDLIVNL